MTERLPLNKVHLWASDIEETKGGVQTFSRFLLKALCRHLSPDACRAILKDGTGAASAKTGLGKVVALGAWPPRLRTAAYAAKLLGEAIRHRPQLVISTHVNFSVMAPVIRRFLPGLRYWCIAHGTDVWDLRDQRKISALRGADLVLAVSDYTRQRLLDELLLDPSRVGVLLNTFDESRFRIAPKPEYLLKRHGLDAATPVILTVARLSSQEQYKGYDQIIRALPSILKSVPNARYVIAGKGDDRPRIEKMVAELGLRDRVIFTGFVPTEELTDHYNLCDVFAMPSKGEGFGIVYLEAMACGKPVLAGNKDGSVSALANGELGVLVDPDNVEQIASALGDILLKRHPHPLIFKPEELRARTISCFGFDQFSATLWRHLRRFGAGVQSNAEEPNTASAT